MGRGENNLLYRDFTPQKEPSDSDDVKLYEVQNKNLIDKIQSNSVIMFWCGLKEACADKREDILEYFFKDKQKTAEIVTKLSKLFQTDRITNYIDNDADVFMMLNKAARENVHGAEEVLFDLLDKDYITHVLADQMNNHFRKILADKKKGQLESEKQALLLESFLSLEEKNPVIRYSDPLCFFEHKASSGGKSKEIVHLIKSNNQESLCRIQLKSEHESIPLSISETSELLEGKVPVSELQFREKAFSSMRSETCNSCVETFSENPDIFKKNDNKKREIPYILNRKIPAENRNTMSKTIIKKLEKETIEKGEVSRIIINNNLKNLGEESKSISDLIYKHQKNPGKKLFNAEDIQKIKNITHFPVQNMRDEDLQLRIKSLPKFYTFD